MDHIPVAEHLRLKILVHVVLVVLRHIGVAGLLPGDEGAVGHIVHLFQIGLQRLGLAFGQ